ncbi:sigma-54-dependent transcriptional regulator [Sorangium sp. So ce341]|uniref:sigma-54-dependent transcriptional regulator n=1 Tax=Sorangium sp. So ce341 TaxID=3133302 RepID=UPI003F5FC73A
MQERIASLIAGLLRSQSFEDAASCALRSLLDVADEALASSRHAKRGVLLRGMVHVRPLDGYRKLLVVEEGAARPEAVSLPSATAWRWVAQHGSAVSIDVNAGKVRLHHTGASVVVREKRVLGGSFDSRESAQRLLARAASHLYVAPMRTPGGSVDGMITLEAECQSAIGQEFIWSACGEHLQLLVDVAAPYLFALPPRPVAAAPDALLPVVGASMAGLVHMVRVFAEQEETILIGGPTGAGKSRLARWCHERSRRRAQRFESLDLMTVPEELQMGELFGWKKGAFSGAVADNPGSIARAEGGTLFIDEIDKLSLKAQAGLLHVLEERRYRPLGEGAGERKADVRFLVGSNADLQAAVRAGRFREDLYYRINVLPVKVPPLDDRADEIPLWADYMVSRRHREGVPEGHARVSDEAVRVLARSRWPGNLRQLDNIVRRAYALALVEAPEARRDMVLEARHVEQALEYEGEPEEAPSLVRLLERAAAAFVAEAERRGPDGPPLDLDQGEVFRGFVMGAAARKLGSKEAAFRLFGRDGLVAHRNHHKVFRREVERVAALCREIGWSGDPPFHELLDDAGD